ncbi:uncharacterized protein LOC110877967 isoform X1 [Helianthus annuus]|uniref:uncharacterized protein LOC110877967 isoform X1 n=1 Tax=Helianthus annuus TaxID=4232 RepID=UPI000B8F5D18|nr:uncharacterized protein LOC110877967 isoform X1 [Helianthus annuus]XP_021981898.1 uncharacterized protein LOC110877967 isoform X1 [Helianthus annuus]
MNPHNNSNQNPASTSGVEQVMNQQMFSCNMPVVAPPFPMQTATGPFPNSIRGFTPQQNLIPFPVNQFNPVQQQQVLVQNTIQNIYQLLQLQNSNYAQCPPGSFPVFQNPGFPMNQQFVMAGPQTIGQQLQGNPFLPAASGSVQPHNFQNQIPQGVGPQNPNLFPNQMFGIPSLNGPLQNVNQGQPGFVSPRQILNTGQTHNPSPTPKNFEDNHKSGPTNVNGGWTEGQHKKFTGHKTYDPSQKGSKIHKHAKQKFGSYKGNMNKAEGGSNLEVDSVSRNFTNFEKRVPSLTYTEQEIKVWREARKKNYPTNGAVLEKHKKEETLSDVTNQDAVLRRQQLKEILTKQAELGCEVAEIPVSYLSSPDKQNPRERKRERQQRYKKGKFNNKRRTSFQDADRMTKKTRPGDEDSFKGNHQTKQNKREPSLLQKLLTRDVKRDKTHLLQVLRFMTANSFFTTESLKFPPVVVRETNVDVPSIETTCSVVKGEEEEEGEIID